MKTLFRFFGILVVFWSLSIQADDQNSIVLPAILNSMLLGENCGSFEADLKNDPLNCGQCGNICDILPHTEPTCQLGECDWVCQSGYSSCDGTIVNGCELDHQAVSGSCGAGLNAGTYDGDESAGFICGGNTNWDNFSTFTGRTDRWFRARVREDSDCPADISHRIRLAVPAGIDFDLYVYRGDSCETLLGSSTVRATGEDESVEIRQTEDSTTDDSFDYYVHVVYVSGTACSSYTIRFDGHNV